MKMIRYFTATKTMTITLYFVRVLPLDPGRDLTRDPGCDPEILLGADNGRGDLW